MRNTESIQINSVNKEELLPEFTSAFPYVASKAYLNKYDVVWHWHKALELFYIESGTLEYYTPSGHVVFPQGSGGLINSEILHFSKPHNGSENTVQLLHIFDASFLYGYIDSRIATKYILPITSCRSIEAVPFLPDNKDAAEILDKLKCSFKLSEHDCGYELKLRNVLSEIWLKILSLQLLPPKHNSINDDKIKAMLVYIYDHFRERVQVCDIASAAFISERECYRLFMEILKTTPNSYIKDYRLQIAKRLLAETSENITDIGLYCGFGSSSEFGKSFRNANGCTPTEYRKKWQDRKN